METPLQPLHLRPNNRDASTVLDTSDSPAKRVQWKKLAEQAPDPQTPFAMVPARYFDSDPEYAQLFMEGFFRPGDSGANPKIKPDWVNDELLARGQRVSREHISGLLFADILSLHYLFAGPSATNPLLATGNSSTPETARRRYLSTTRRVLQWYHGDLWGDSSAAREVMVVRSMHSRVRQLLHSHSRGSLQGAVALKPTEAQVSRPVWQVLQDVLAEKRNDIFMPDHYSDIQREYLSQTEMAATQFGFFGLVIQSPRRFGMHGVTEDDLEALVHLWAAIGYQLGIEDRFNKCIGGLAAARRAWAFYRDRFFMPSLAFANPTWEHMSRCVVKGLERSLVFIPSQEGAIWWLMGLNGLHEAKAEIRRLLSWRDLVMFWMVYFTFEFLMRANLVRRFVNTLMCLRVRYLCRRYLQNPALPARGNHSDALKAKAFHPSV